MKILAKTVWLTAVFMVCLSLLTVGCTKYASPDDLKKLDEAQKAAVSAEKELDQLKKERADLERQIAQKQHELDDLQEQLDEIKGIAPAGGEVKQ
ncbi:MAG: hypothetical protein FJY65_02700 [Calditrichaeota bacterium]|nr:hypothetical protein [Calditrichota bacterium]